MLAALTSNVSHPPTMLSPRPTFSLHISIVDSLPAATGQLTGSEVSDLPMGQQEEEEEETAGVGEGSGGRGQEYERDAGGGGGGEGGRVSERLMESLTVTRCLRIKLDTWVERRLINH